MTRGGLLRGRGLSRPCRSINQRESAQSETTAFLGDNRRVSGYPDDMATTLSAPRTVDLSGLPEPVATDIERLVQHLRANLPADSNGTAAQAVDRDMPSKYLSHPKPTLAELNRLLGELATGTTGVVLPADFSRANLYDDHD